MLLFPGAVFLALVLPRSIDMVLAPELEAGTTGLLLMLEEDIASVFSVVSVTGRVSAAVSLSLCCL